MDVGILIFDGVEELDFVGPYEVFAMSNEVFTRHNKAPPENIKIIAPDLDPVTCAKRMQVLPDAAVRDVNRLDALLVPGGRGTRALVQNSAVLAWISSIAADAEWTTSVCTGAFLLAAAGVSSGKRVTTHWRAVNEMRGYNWPVEIVPGQRFVADGKVVSAAGVSAGIDMALWLVGQWHGPDHARATQKAMEYFPQPPYGEDA
ncbi:MAG: DJ-1/PfpI family protein [Alphaproteobacteria bacterium]|nr:DJ-1/PfpI family protein [Alphaproteobacteria bacterium]